MAIFDSLKDAVGALFGNGESAQQAFVEGRRYVGRKNKRAQLRAQKEVPALFRVTSKIAWDFASVDWTYRDVESGEPIDEDKPFVKSLSQPNPELTLTQVRALSMQYRDVVGEWIHVLVPTEDETGQPKLEFWPIPPTDVQKNGDTWEVDHNSARYQIPDDAVVHEKMPDLQDPYGRGYGYGGVLSDELMTFEHASEFTSAQFANSARPDVIVNLEGGGESAIEQFKNMWTKKYGGPKNAGKPLVSAGTGDISLETLTPPIKDTKVQEIKQASIDEVRKNFGVPPSIMGELEDSNRSSIKTEELIYAKNVLKPRLKQWKRMVEEDIAPLFERNVIAEYEDPTPRDVDNKLELLDKRPEVITVNEAREIVGLPPREDGDVYLRPAEKKLREVPASEVESDDQQSKAVPGPDSWEMKVLGDEVKVIESEPKQLESGCSCCPQKKSSVVKQNGDDLPPDEELTEEQRQTIEDAGKLASADQIRDELQAEFESQIRDAGVEESEFLDIELTDNQQENFDQNITQMVDEFGADKVKQINETTKQDIRDVVKRGVVEGKNPRDITSDINGLVSDQVDTPKGKMTIPNRSQTIARTEMGRAQSAATHEFRKATGEFQQKRWVATRDNRVRAEHIGIDGQQRDMGKPFEIGANDAMYPLDFGVAELDINCRCTTVPIADELTELSVDGVVEKVHPDKELSDRFKDVYWDRFDKSLQDREQEFLEVVERVLTNQFEEHILPNIESVLRN